MRDPARIERVLTQLNILWLKDPDLRLGQLFSLLKNLSSQKDQDGLYIEDDELEEIMKKLIYNGVIL
jgi:uncharacterized protein YihD (DUF1040 family)